MKVVSVHVGRPREVIWEGRVVSTGIFKYPVDGRVAVRRYNLDGDGQADLTAHGGKNKAVYTYPSEHYAYWRQELPEMELPWSIFGENLTTEGLSEETVRIGDRFRVGRAVLRVTQPRIPCYKLGIRFGREDIVKRFLQSGRSGIYFTIEEEGDVAAGDAITLLERDEQSMTVAEVVRLFRDGGDEGELRRAVELSALPDPLHSYFLKKLESINKL